ncbi:MAG TPA: AAA family ATPase [Terriglobales bacterium]|jgi:hypothetical protein|nr:AAA family ATPase [Terriglobales bacterium]
MAEATVAAKKLLTILRFSKLPADLRRQGKFCVYREEPNGNKKPRKVPYQPHNPKLKADMSKPETLSDFDTAVEAMRKGKFDGINALCSPEFTFVDLDSCVSDGDISDEAYRIIGSLPKTYWELSPSGTGLHGIFRCDGEFPALKVGNVEAYCAKHFMSVTGNQVPNGAKKIANATAADFEKLRPVKTPAAVTANTSDKLNLLLAGNFAGAGFPSASEADLSLCGTLAKRGLPREAVETIWRGSGLNRDKLERDDYRERVLNTAFTNVKVAEAYTGDGSDWESAFPAVSQFDGDEFPERHIIKGLFGHQSVLAIPGAPEANKTLGVLEMCRAMLAGKGAKAFNHFEVLEDVAGIIYAIPEMSRSNFVRFARFFKLNDQGSKFRHRSAADGATIQLDDPRLQKAVRDRVLILDTLLYFSGAEDTYKASEWLWFSTQCRRLIDEFGCLGIILLHHPTKAGAEASDIDIMKFLSQSIALAGLIDLCFAFRRKPDSESEVVVKCLKARIWDKHTQPFIISSRDKHGDSFISKGEFPCTSTPGTVDVREALKSRNGRKPAANSEQMAEKAKELATQGMSQTEITAKLKAEGHNISRSGVQKLLAKKKRKF